jgi:hypothetical protein
MGRTAVFTGDEGVSSTGVFYGMLIFPRPGNAYNISSYAKILFSED